MKVHEFAQRAGLGPDVVRYYVRVGLLSPTRNPGNGYKIFGRADLTRAEFIRRSQAVGFTLREIRGLLGQIDRGECPCEDMRAALDVKVRENEERLRTLLSRQREIEAVRSAWDQSFFRAPNLGGLTLGDLCRILETRQSTAVDATVSRPGCRLEAASRLARRNGQAASAITRESGTSGKYRTLPR